MNPLKQKIIDILDKGLISYRNDIVADQILAEIKQEPPKIGDWEKEFENKFLPIKAHFGNPPKDITEHIKSFIRGLLKTQTTEIVKEIENEIDQQLIFGKGKYEKGWNDSLAELKTLLNSQKRKSRADKKNKGRN